MAGEVAPPTLEIPPDRRPRHIAIIMDGNGRWAERQNLPRVAGHQRGVDSVRRIGELVGRPIEMVSVGPERDQTIVANKL